VADHYCCKRCGLKYQSCSCPLPTDAEVSGSKFSPDGKTLTIVATVPPGPLADRLRGAMDLRQTRACQGCAEQRECEYRDTTAVNAMSPDGKGAWLCDECDEEIRSKP
jgi:hypothetical protein